MALHASCPQIRNWLHVFFLSAVPLIHGVVPGTAVAAGTEKVVGRVQSANPKTGVVVLETDAGEVTVQVTPKTKNFKIIAVGMNLIFTVKETNDELVAQSVVLDKKAQARPKINKPTKTEPGSGEPSSPADEPQSNQVDDEVTARGHYGLQPYIPGDASIRPNGRLLGQIAELDLSKLYRFQSTKQIAFEKMGQETVITVQGKLHPDQRAWAGIASQLADLFEPWSTTKLRFQTTGRIERPTVKPKVLEEGESRKFSDLLPFWERMRRAIVDAPVAGRTDFPFGEASIIPQYGLEHPKSWNSWVLICTKWDDAAPEDRNSADWVAYRLNFDPLLTLEELRHFLGARHELVMTLTKDGGIAKEHVRPHVYHDDRTLRKIARPFIGISTWEIGNTYFGDCWSWHPFMPVSDTLWSGNGTQAPEYSEKFVVPFAVEHDPNDVQLQTKYVEFPKSRADSPDDRAPEAEKPDRTSREPTTNDDNFMTQSSRLSTNAIDVVHPSVIWGDDSTIYLVGHKDGVVSLNSTSLEIEQTLSYPASFSGVVGDDYLRGAYYATACGENRKLAVISKAVNVPHRVSLLDMNSGEVDSTLVRTRLFHDAQGIAQLNQVLGDLNYEEPVSIAGSPNGKRVAISTLGQDLTLWDLGKKSHHTLMHPDKRRFGCAAFSPDSRRLAAADTAGGLWIFDLETRKPVLMYQTLADLGRFPKVDGNSWERPVSMTFTADGQFIVIGDRTQCSARVCNAKTGKVLFDCRLGSGGGIWALSAHPKLPVFAAGGADAGISLWSAKTGKRLDTFGGNDEYILAAAFSPDGNRLAIFRGWSEIEVWDVSNPISALIAE
jgi:WD40 repeat protein